MVMGQVRYTPNRYNHADDILLRIGSDGDTVLVNRSTSLGANTALTGVLVGTPVTPIAIAANSLIIGNITASGDVVIAVNKGGTSHMAFMADASTGDTIVQASTGQSVDIYIAGTKVLDVAVNLATYSAAASTANQVLAITNTSNAAAASHAYLDISVGGTTSTGDPQLRLTIPGGTSYYIGLDNNDFDILYIGTGTTVSGSPIVYFDTTTTGVANRAFMNLTPVAVTLNDSAAISARGITLNGFTVTLAGETVVTTLQSGILIAAITFTKAVNGDINRASGVSSTPPDQAGALEIIHSSAFRAITGGAAVNVSGIYLAAQTAGTTNNFQVLMANGGTEPANAVVDLVGLYAVDIAAGRATLGIRSEETVIATAELASTHKLVVRINGTSYAIMLTTTLT